MCDSSASIRMTRDAVGSSDPGSRTATPRDALGAGSGSGFAVAGGFRVPGGVGSTRAARR